MMTKAGRILVMRSRFIGDTVLTVPFLRNLRRAEPQAYIAWMVAPGSSDVVQGIPYVDEMITWDPITIHADSRGAHSTLAAKWGLSGISGDGISIKSMCSNALSRVPSWPI